MSAKTDDVQAAIELALQAAVNFAEVESDPNSGRHAQAVAYSEYLSALMQYHIAELRSVGQPSNLPVMRVQARAASKVQCQETNTAAGQCRLITDHNGAHINDLKSWA